MISEDKINSVLTENSDKIFFYALRHTGNESEAEDLAQDIMLAILSSYKNLRNDDALYGFIWRVAQNQCRLWARKKSRSAATVSLDETEPQNIAVLYFGSGDNIYYRLCRKKIVQNILMACYNDACTLQDISLQISKAQQGDRRLRKQSSNQ